MTTEGIAMDISDLTEEPPEWCVVAAELPRPLFGCAGGEEFEGYELSGEAWGEAADDRNSGLLAFAYLWRRFGPPTWGSDPYKDLCRYILGTPMEGVYAVISPRGSGIRYGVSFIGPRSLDREIRGPHMAWLESLGRWARARGYADGFTLCWAKAEEAKADYRAAIEELGECPRPTTEGWRDDPGPVGRLNRAIYATLRELLRPVYVRDCAANILGRCDDHEHPAERSKYAGLGIDLTPLDAMLAEEEDRRNG